MKTIVITGAANGVGKALAKAFQNECLILVDRDRKNLEEVASMLNANYYVCDISNDEEVETLVSDLLEEYEYIDVLINNAGLWIG